MQFAEITVAELLDFVEGNLWEQLNPKPITTLRAISQYQNPRAKPSDTALIIAYENNLLIGLVGLLPNLINGQPEQIANSNTCWWVHPEKGKQLAIPLFLKAFAKCDQRMFMTNCTPHTLSILKRTNWFDFPQTAPGRRGFLKFNLHEIIPIKFPKTLRFKPLFKTIDIAMNYLLFPYQKINQLRFANIVTQVEYLHSLDDELNAFIQNHSENEFNRRTGVELDWILKFPWIIGKRTDQSIAQIDYPFSYMVENFEQYFVKVTAIDQTVGLLFISIRDGHMKIPYAYFNEKYAHLILKVIYQQAVRKKVITLTVFNSVLANRMDSVANPFVFKKKINRLIAISKQLSFSYQKYPEIQDGDGDVVFT